MERYEIGDHPRLTALIEAANQGDEAVLTCGGTVVAEIRPRNAKSARSMSKPPMDLVALEALRKRLPRIDDEGAALVRAVRDQRDW